MIKPLLVCFSFLTLVLTGCASATSNEPRECPIHQQPMSRELVVLRNGIASWEYQEDREKYFPYSGTIYTGNVLPSTQQQMAQAEICPVCRNTEMKWFRGDFAPTEKKDPKAQTPGDQKDNPSSEDQQKGAEQPK